MNIGTLPSGKLDYEILLWQPNSPAAKAVRMTLRWEAHSPDDIDMDRGLIMFDLERLWRNLPQNMAPKKLTLELRINRDGPWEESAALRGSIALQFGVRLAADWADVRAMASAQRELFLIGRSKGKVVDVVPLARTDFNLPLTDIKTFRDKVRAKATGPNVPCPTDEIVIA